MKKIFVGNLDFSAGWLAECGDVYYTVPIEVTRDDNGGDPWIKAGCSESPVPIT